MKEVLSKYGEIKEVWFDGSCHINVKDILEKYTPGAVVFQGPMASLRWVGNEDGYAPYSNWYTISHQDLATGVSTAIQSDPFGDVYAPVEVDVPLLKNKGHKWFWAPNTDTLILSTDKLMEIYYKSVGRGAVLLLNSTPDTTGLIPPSHVAAYRAFGKEIKRRFDHPIKETKGEGNFLEMTFSKPTEINHIILQEDLTMGQRVLAYTIEGMNEKGHWSKVYDGTSIGHKRIVYFAPVTLKKVKVTFSNTKATPQIANFAVYNIKRVGFKPEKRKKDGPDPKAGAAIEIGKWTNTTFQKNRWKEVSFDLTKYVTKTGQYLVSFQEQDKSKVSGLDFKDWEIEIYGEKMNAVVEFLKGKFRFSELPALNKHLMNFKQYLDLK